MKKFLAILLSVVMLFSFAVVGFAGDDDAADTDTTVAELPANMGKLAGKIVFSFDNTYLEPSSSYTIPLRIYGDYTVPENAETVYLGVASIALEGEIGNHADITGIRFNSEIDVTPIQIGYDEDMDDTLFSFSVSKENFDSVLSTSDEGVVVGYVDLETNEDLPEVYGEELGVLFMSNAYFFDYVDFGDMEVTPTDAGGYITFDGESEEFVPFVLEGDGIELCYDTAHFYHSPRVLTWQERLEKWAIEQALLILNFIGTINNALIGILQGLLKDII